MLNEFTEIKLRRQSLTQAVTPKMNASRKKWTRIIATPPAILLVAVMLQRSGRSQAI
jgi:hypothetical protein